MHYHIVAGDSLITPAYNVQFDSVLIASATLVKLIFSLDPYPNADQDKQSAMIALALQMQENPETVVKVGGGSFNMLFFSCLGCYNISLN